jgi:hypothetical protein
MSLLGLNLTLAIGQFEPAPAPQSLTQALQRVEVTRTDDGPSGFQLTFYGDRSGPFAPDYALLTSPLLQPFNRVLLTVTINGTPRVLLDGIITHQQLQPGDFERGSTLVVTGEDVSVMMDLIQVSIEYPSSDDAIIVGIILAKYIALGIVPEIVPPVTSFLRTPEEGTWQQNGTDRNELQNLAANHGYIFCIRPGPVTGMNTAYWGPPPYTGLPQKAISVNLGPATNTLSASFSYNALAPTLVAGLFQDPETETDLPVAILTSTRTPLSARPALLGQRFNRMLLFNQALQANAGYPTAIDITDAIASAQAITDASTDNVVTVEGELDTLRYNDLLTAPGLVGLRGAGDSYDGTYYVKSVTHTISNQDYRQKFTLTREGLGSLTQRVMP